VPSLLVLMAASVPFVVYLAQRPSKIVRMCEHEMWARSELAGFAKSPLFDPFDSNYSDAWSADPKILKLMGLKRQPDVLLSMFAERAGERHMIFGHCYFTEIPGTGDPPALRFDHLTITDSIVPWAKSP
jgi:hypothetical protein